jgi:hypothetical protein
MVDRFAAAEQETEVGGQNPVAVGEGASAVRGLTLPGVETDPAVAVEPEVLVAEQECALAGIEPESVAVIESAPAVVREPESVAVIEPASPAVMGHPG